jgi:hypothetical protein
MKISEANLLKISDLEIKLTRKKIKNLHLKIQPPTAEIKVSAPLKMNLKIIEDFLIKKLQWIKQAQQKIRELKIQAPKRYLSGEKHYFFGQKYQLEVIADNKNFLLKKENILEIHSRKNSTIMQRKKILEEWYRQEINKIAPLFILKMEEKMQVKVLQMRIKKMKTRWGTCNIKAKRIWLSLELAKKPIECLQFIIIHEMTHLLERKHSKKFFNLMDQFMPNWRDWDQILKNRNYL